MSNYWETLRRSLVDRARALGAYLRGLEASSARSDQGFGLALEMCRRYTEIVVDQVNDDWSEAVDGEERERILIPHLKGFLARERWIDQRFARGSQHDVPRALKTVARREFAALGLDGHEPVLTVGPPDSFETHLSDLVDHLFGDLHRARHLDELAHLFAGPKLSIISVPYIEGTRALWHPITLGHEAAHIRLEKTKGHLSRVGLTEGWLRKDDEALRAHWLEQVQDTPDRTPPRVDLGAVLERWVTEILCDLNAVRRFGPAGLSAIAEFLAVLSPAQRAGLKSRTASSPVRRAYETHPPLEVRLALMFRYLGELGYERAALPHHARVWLEYRGGGESELPVEISYLVRVVQEDAHVSALIEYIGSWGRSYRAETHAGAVRWLEQEFLDGIPGGTHFTDGQAWSAVSVPDVVNAVWAARSALDEVAPAGSPTPALFVLEEHERRVLVDKLASKAIDSLELARLWGDHRGMVGPQHASIRAMAQDAENELPDSGSVLSRGWIARRLNARNGTSDERLVVTPLFEDSIQDAGVDVRLGPDFIVFRHSAISAFDPLAANRSDVDPRRLQERVYKAWGETFILHPGELVLASTLEYIVLPDDVAAQVVTRSSYGRLGLITATAVQVQPGSRGCITLELVNHGETPIALTPGARVGQLVLFKVAAAAPVKRGKYWFPVGPEFSKVNEDPDAAPLRTVAGRGAAFGSSLGAIEFMFAGSPSDATVFLDTAQAQHVDVERHMETMAIGTASVDQLSVTAVRFTQGSKKSLVMSDLGNRLEIAIDENPAAQRISVVDRTGRRIDRIPQGGHIAEVADALARALGQRA